MDASELDADVKLYKAAGELLSELLAKLPLLLTSPSGRSRKWVWGSKVEELAKLLDRFQEWPQLLDPHLAVIVKELADHFVAYCIDSPHLYLEKHDHQAEVIPLPRGVARVLYSLCKVRGQKVIVRLLNNEPKFVEPLLMCFRLWGYDSSSDVSLAPSLMGWEERYMMLLWLSHLMLAPFELSSISILAVMSPESATGIINSQLPAVAQNLLCLALDHLQVSSKAREAASTLIIRLCYRSDMQVLALPTDMVQWALKQLSTKTVDAVASSYRHIGLLRLLFGMINTASDSESSPFLKELSTTICLIANPESSTYMRDQAFARKLMVKIMRATTIHAISLSSSSPPLDYNSYTDDLLEETIQILLEYLSDKETPVRQAASKALSLIVLKLDSNMSAEVTEAVLGCLNENMLLEDRNADTLIPLTDELTEHAVRYRKNVNAVDPLKWHGAMLTLGHLLFRRSPPLEQLSPIIEALLLGLEFEQRSNVGTSVGVGVRDAACFGLWSLARKYSTEELSSIEFVTALFADNRYAQGEKEISLVQLIAVRLVVSACLDPSGNLRRGSSAALQELIGRHPDAIIEGIPVVQIVDYHAVARRSRAIDEVALAVSKLDESYHTALQYALLQWRGTRATDTESRRFAAAAVGSLYSSMRSENKTHYLSALVSEIRSLRSSNVGSSAAARHGLILALAYILQSDLNKSDHARIVKDLDTVSPLLHDLRLLSGMIEGRVTSDIEHVLEALAVFISALAGCVRRIRQSEKSLTAQFDGEAWNDQVLAILERCTVASDKEIVAESAAKANVSMIRLTPILVQKVRSWFDPNIQNRFEFCCKGRIDTMGAIFIHLDDIREDIPDVSTNDLRNEIVTFFHGVIYNSRSSIEIKVNVMRNIRILLASSASPEGHPLKLLIEAIEIGLSDYTVDQRGDIGSALRLTAIDAAQVLLRNHVLSVHSFTDILSLIVRLATERLAKMRFRAYMCLKDIFEQHQTITSWSIFGEQDSISLSLDDVEHQADVSSQQYYATFMPFLKFPGYHEKLILGIISSVSTGTEDISRAATAALISFMLTLTEKKQSGIFWEMLAPTFLQLLHDAEPEDRQVVPAIDFATVIFEQVALIVEGASSASFMDSPYWKRLQSVHVPNSTLLRLEALVRLYGSMLTIDDLRAVALERLTRMLLHKWPKVRLAAATTIFSHFPVRTIQCTDWYAAATANKSVVIQLREELEAHMRRRTEDPLAH